MSQTASLVSGGFSNVRTLNANGHLLRLLEDSLKDHFGLIVADEDRSLRSQEGRLFEGPAQVLSN